MNRFILPLSVILVFANTMMSSLDAAVFQYAVHIGDPSKQAEALLWIPPASPHVRGVLASSMTLAEKHMSVDPQIRKACADQHVAILFMTRGTDATGLQVVLDRLAQVSGYSELSFAPLMFTGHSAGGPSAKKLATQFATRCFGLMQYRGGIPGGNDPLPAGVPTLTMVGQFDEFGGLMRDENKAEPAWEVARDSIAAYRAANEAHLASILVEPGAGHFAWSDRNAAYLALFIRKAAAARIPEWNIDTTEPVICRTVDPGNGWLTSLDLRNIAATKSALANEYPGDKKQTSWHFDKELAEATVAYHAGLSGRKDQFIQWDDPYWLDAGTRYFFTKLTWVNDGQTLEVHPSYAGSYPNQKGGPHWLQAGQPVGHSTAPILVKPVSGPLVATGANTFRIKFDNVNPAGDFGRPTFMAYSVGDSDYRHTEHVGMMPRGFKGLTQGQAQTITFEPISNLKADAAPVPLKATSDAGLTVEFYVAAGPAEVVDGKLKIAELPSRTRFPVTVRVVACQFGRGIEPFVKTAVPVEQTIQIEKP